MCELDITLKIGLPVRRPVDQAALSVVALGIELDTFGKEVHTNIAGTFRLF